MAGSRIPKCFKYQIAPELAVSIPSSMNVVSYPLQQAARLGGDDRLQHPTARVTKVLLLHQLLQQFYQVGTATFHQANQSRQCPMVDLHQIVLLTAPREAGQPSNHLTAPGRVQAGEGCPAIYGTNEHLHSKSAGPHALNRSL